jgi:hypothetical protein
MLKSARPLLFWCLIAATSGLSAVELPFPVVTVQRQTLPDEQVLDGVVEAVHQSTVSPRPLAESKTIMVDVNDFVPQGAPIVRIRNIEQRARIWIRPRPVCARRRLVSPRPRPTTIGFAAFMKNNWWPRRRWTRQRPRSMPPKPAWKRRRPGWPRPRSHWVYHHG